MKVDLHLHSTASDGQYPPAVLVALAKEHHIEGMALTDHDTMDGIAEALVESRRQGILFLPGIELSAAEYANFHILGYGIDWNDPGLKKLCEDRKQERERHTVQIARFLARQGVTIDLAEVEALAGTGSVGRPHFAQVMVRHGYVKTNREAFDRYLDTEAYRCIPQNKPSAFTCVSAIHAAGGKAVLAHPYQLKLGKDALDTLLGTMKPWGLDGLECFYPKHTPEQRAFYLHLAEKYQLHVTAGSDFHGQRVHPGDQLIPTELDVNWLLSAVEKEYGK